MENVPMKCPKCDHENPSSAKFCRNCGAKLPSACPECGRPVNPEDRFCMECGARLLESEPTKKGVAVPRLEDMHSQLQSLIPEELAQKYAKAEPQAAGENRPVTALFADISGFTPLSSTQSSETILQMVQDCFRQLVGIVARYEGIISGFRGDGLLALFGAPILHENDAERAIRAAMDMRNAMHERQLEVTIGINTAPMTVGEIQTQLHREYTAYGTDVILASRLQEVAEPGQILAGTGTHRLTRRIFDFQIVRDIELQGFPQPVTAYTVQQVKVHPEKLRGIEGLRARMIGREHEFAELKESADQWLNGQGQMVCIIGEAGIGKSRLVAELRQYLDTRHGTQDSRQEGDDTTSLKSEVPGLKSQVSGLMSVLEGRCVSIGQPISYWPFIDILRTYFGFREEDDTPAIARKVTESIASLMPQAADETLPLLGNLLSIKYGDELDDRLKFASPEQIRHQTLMRLRDMFRTLAEQQPLLLILEDLHWADDLSLDLVSLLMDELANTPLLLLCVYRPEKEHRVWQLSDQARRKCLDRYTEIRLNPLSSLQSRQLVESLLEIENLPESVKGTILEKSEGNPFFIEEVIRSLIEQDMVYQDGDHWKARDEISSISVPDTIQSVVLARVDRLKAEAKYVLQCASVIGRLFRYRLLQHISRQEQDLDSYISEFEAKELIYEERTVPELEYAFKHAFTQEATYEGILKQKRREFHNMVAFGIERLYEEQLEDYYEELAHHYSRSDNPEKAVEYLLKAGDKCRRLFANQDAIDYFQNALAILDKLNRTREHELQRFQVIEGLGDVYITIGKRHDSIPYLDNAIELGARYGVAPLKLVELYRCLGRSYGFLGQRDKQIEILEAGLSALDQKISCSERALILGSLLDAYKNKGNMEKTDEYTSKILSIIKETGDFEGIELVYDDLAWANDGMKRDPDRSIMWRRKAIEIREHKNDKIGLALGYHNLGDTLNFFTRSREMEAIHYYEKGFSLAEEIGYTDVMMWNHVDLGGLLVGLKERLDEAYEHLKTGAKLAVETDDTEYIVYVCGHLRRLFDIYLDKGDWEKAIEYSTIPEEIEHPAYVAHNHELLGILAMRQHNWDEAISHLQESRRFLQEWENISDVNYDYIRLANIDITLARTYLRKGEAKQTLARFEEIAERSMELYDGPLLLSIFSRALAGLERAYASLGAPDRFSHFCNSFRKRHPDAIAKVGYFQWHLEPAETSSDFRNPAFDDDFSSDTLKPSWIWVDDTDDSSYRLDTMEGVEISPANGRGLTSIKQDAPRILREFSGDFAVEVQISPVSDDKPQIGGLLVWKDNSRYLLFEKGFVGQDEVRMLHYSDGRWSLPGRGFIPLEGNEGTYLRLERSGDELTSYCSTDGENWFTCGKAILPIEDPIQVGIYAIGMIDRTIYCGEYKEGTATVFRNFRIWKR
jgi:class 3 adenylate cyclase/tetratricopeptide (TPR) repeat protein/regulation of enolase protein 1 (concanavalin A-like superfamily)